jgi:hypothetical protein
MLPKAAQVGCTGVTIGAAGVAGAAFITTVCDVVQFELLFIIRV